MTRIIPNSTNHINKAFQFAQTDRGYFTSVKKRVNSSKTIETKDSEE